MSSESHVHSMSSIGSYVNVSIALEAAVHSFSMRRNHVPVDDCVSWRPQCRRRPPGT